MSDLPAAPAQEVETSNAEAPSVRRGWVATTLTVLFAAMAVILVSYFAVATNL